MLPNPWYTADDGQFARPPSESRALPWLLLAGAVVVVALLRYAVDVLLFVCLACLLGSVIGAIIDWYSGDSVPGWALGSAGASTVATVVLVEWVVTWAAVFPPVEGYIPAAILTTTAKAESHGWGQRVWLPDRTPSSSGAPAIDSAVALSGTTHPEVESTRWTQPRGLEQSAETTRSGRGGETRQAGLTTNGKVKTSIRIESSQPTSRAGAPIRLTAHVSSPSGQPPSGLVVFRRLGAVLGSAQLDREGRASIEVRGLRAGTHEISAEFDGSPPFAGSHSPRLVQVIQH